MTGATSRAGTAYPSGASEFTPVIWGFVLLDLQFFVIVVCTFSFGIALYVLPFTDSDYPFGILKLFLFSP
jgi:hypothetical protein